MAEAPANTSIEYFPPAKPWEEREGNVHLLGMRCPSCNTTSFPVKPICHVCGSDRRLESVSLSPFGRLYSYTQVHVGPKGFPLPYIVGYVDMEDGVRLFGQLENQASELAIDDPMCVVLGQVRVTAGGAPVISYKFRKRQ